MPRLLFEKTGNAVWMSHLDLMRLFQRAFKRAGLHLKHTQGFNPRPSVSIAMPLSVGIWSRCELLDFDLDEQTVPNEEITERLNKALVSGVRVLQTYDTGRKLKELSLLRSSLVLRFDKGADESVATAVRELFRRPSLTVEKRNKNGVTEQDILPMIRDLAVEVTSPATMTVRVLAFCREPSLNPMQVAAAISRYLPEHAPDGVRCIREEIFDETETIFR